MRRLLLVLLLVAAPAAARAQALPDCRALLPLLDKDPTSIVGGEPLLRLEYLVEDANSEPETRECSGVALYRSSTQHLTFVAKWRDAQHNAIDVDAHLSTPTDGAARARALRRAHHPAGSDGTYDAEAFVPSCTDADFRRRAQSELRLGISVHDRFFIEPKEKIFDLVPNGYDSGYMANCVATVGEAKPQGQLFMGTQWVTGANGERFEFYVLDTGPQDFQLSNRLWTMGTE